MIHTFGKENPYTAPEDYFQRACCKYLWFQYPKLLWFHVPNGGYRNKREASKFKDLGVRSGVSDLIFLEPRGQYAGLIIELKTKKNTITENQEKFLTHADENGYLCVVCYNYEYFIKTVDKYFKEEKRKPFSN